MTVIPYALVGLVSSLFSASTMALSARRTVLVTGASRGIGQELCKVILQDYPDVDVILTSRSISKGKQVAQALIETLGKECEGRLEVVELDTASDESVARASEQIKAKHEELYGIVNNAGIAFGDPVDIMNTNYWGPRRVNDALSTLLSRPGGRIVNIASASGPNWLSRLSNKELKSKLAQPWTIKGGIEELDQIASSVELTSQTYGISKAFLNAYTCLHAMAEPDLIINSVTPGFIATDMGLALGATNPVEMGVRCPLFALFDKELDSTPTGRYYGSDCKRSPLDVYRGPGDPVYVGPDWKDAYTTK
jgi:NAD(P)-dependent dehydrogenase (short-subunit alcohol dehydrogenase family)